MTRSARRAIAAFGLCSLVLVSGGCNKVPANAALEEAEQALAAAPDIATYAPAEFAAITATIRDARTQLDAGRYTDALRAAQALPDRIRAAAEAAGKRKQQATATWNDLAVSLPKRVEAIAARLAALAAAEGLRTETLAGWQGELASVTQAWAAATAAFERGEITKAAEAAQDVKAKAESLAGKLRLPAAPGGSAPSR